MAEHIKKTAKEQFFAHENFYAASARVLYFDSISKVAPANQKDSYDLKKGEALLYAGKTKDAIKILEVLWEKSKKGLLTYTLNTNEEESIGPLLAIAYMRLGEQENCIHHHDASASCIVPIQANGFHHLQEGSRKAISLYEEFLTYNSHDYASRWLLNVAYMTLGEYPSGVPEKWLIPESAFESEYPLKKFDDVAPKLGLNVNELSGGSVVDDFNNDNLLDVMVSSWFPTHHLRYFVNNGDGSFTEKSKTAGIMETGGGLNMVQADYNNDGFLDVFILRGAWMGTSGKQPNSLLRNNGDDTFTDVTIEAGLLSFHPTQAAVWADFNNDGWLDLFIGNESEPNDINESELYINNKNGTFSKNTLSAGLTISEDKNPNFIKGVAAGDFNNDGWMDIYVSTVRPTSRNLLFINKGVDKKGNITFDEIGTSVGLDEAFSSFPTWFFDYDNDGWLDIFVAGYDRVGLNSIASEIVKEYLGEPYRAETLRLFKNNNGVFTNVSTEMGLDRIGYAMGANYGDLDNDGFLDIYLSTGEVSYQSIIPNIVFRNNAAENFQDVTTAGGFGNIQKGHAVSFSDIDNDGDQDINVVMGGAFEGDNFFNSLLKNPYQNENNWLTIRLEGTKANRSAIGSRIEVTTMENGKQRKIYHTISSGGSFGCSTLRAEIGLGKASEIIQIKIIWAGSRTQQIFKNIKLNSFYKIVEGNPQPQHINLKPLDI
ncbi:CRTAC1 family protein [Confluentibacter lentus]|uniref:CRTAC1 family protein n=1 Tax=Confluentibacter lentus TaxID=1699412 RepID=UPI0018E225FE|nr:CRTAC1 family protein [Confluentibacter lentus]